MEPIKSDVELRDMMMKTCSTSEWFKVIEDEINDVIMAIKTPLPRKFSTIVGVSVESKYFKVV